MTSLDEIKALIAQKELFIFDLDGTLFNTLGDLAPAVNYAMTQFGLHTHSNDDVRTFIGNGSMNLIRRAVAANFIDVKEVRNFDKVAAVLERKGYSEESIKEIHKVYSEFYWEHCTENTESYKGVIELVQRIADENRDGNRAVFNRDENHAGTRCAAMLTNKPVAPAEKILKKFGSHPQKRFSKNSAWKIRSPHTSAATPRLNASQAPPAFTRFSARQESPPKKQS